MLGRFYEFRPEKALNNFITSRKRYENGERELADLLAQTKKTVEVFAPENRFNKRKDNEKRLFGVDHHHTWKLLEDDLKTIRNHFKNRYWGDAAIPMY